MLFKIEQIVSCDFANWVLQLNLFYQAQSQHNNPNRWCLKKCAVTMKAATAIAIAIAAAPQEAVVVEGAGAESNPTAMIACATCCSACGATKRTPRLPTQILGKQSERRTCPCAAASRAGSCFSSPRSSASRFSSSLRTLCQCCAKNRLRLGATWKSFHH